MKQRDREEQLFGEYGRGRIIEMIDYQNVVCLPEANLQVYLKELGEEQHQQGVHGECSTITTTRERRWPCCPHCNKSFKTLYLSIMSQCSSPQPSSDAVVTNQNETYCSSPYGTCYCSPEFLEQVQQLESMARETMQRKKRINFNPPSFSLRISSEKG
ncbi:hypothetical protein Cgig2_028028 [Carnegiea gigantea]|uniref:Uncharacterized protein n=1 Tax=Carnegiea gigantea TaxID=171969 RepID=A0A9Q1H0S0_9CARY|nr:hypothetical protein Cgig2_028028 [Carnegiea gigantea]